MIYASPDGRVSVERISLHCTPPGDRRGTRFAGDGVHYVVRTLGSVSDRIRERPGDDFDQICQAQGLVAVDAVPKSRDLWKRWAAARIRELEEEK